MSDMADVISWRLLHLISVFIIHLTPGLMQDIPVKIMIYVLET